VRASRCKTPILVLTAVDAVPKILRAFDLGADDYLVKPFILQILLARVGAIARRAATAELPPVAAVGVTLDRSRRVAIRHGKQIAFTRKQFELLEALIRRTGSITTREQLIEAGWGLTADVKENTLDVSRLSQFSADASHDLRTSLTVMLATAQLSLHRHRSEEEYRNALDKIVTECHTASTLLDALLSLAQSDNFVHEVAFKKIDLCELVVSGRSSCTLILIRQFVQDRRSSGGSHAGVRAKSSCCNSTPSQSAWIHADRRSNSGSGYRRHDYDLLPC